MPRDLAGEPIVADGAGLVTRPARLPIRATAAVQRGFNGDARLPVNDIVAACAGRWATATGGSTITCGLAGADVTAQLPAGAWVELRAAPMTPAPSTIRRVLLASFNANGDSKTTVQLDAPYPSARTGLTLLTGVSVLGAEPLGIAEMLVSPEEAAAALDVNAAGATAALLGAPATPPSASARAAFRFVITGLAPNVPLFASVSVANDRGFSAPQVSVPASLAPPRQKPDPPQRVSLHSISSAALQVAFYAPASNGGDAITKYLAEWDTRPTFDSTPG